MVKFNKSTKIILIIISLLIIGFTLYNQRYKFTYLYSYTLRHYKNSKYIYTNKFDQFVNYRKNFPQYILLSDHTSLLKKFTLPEVLNGKAVVLYFRPVIKKFKDQMYERRLKMLFYKANFLIKKNGFLITQDSIPPEKQTYVSEYIADSLKNIKRVYSNDAPFFKALGKKSIWLPAENDTMLNEKMQQIRKLIKRNKAIIAHYDQSYFLGRLGKNKLIELFSNNDTFAIYKALDGIVIYNNLKNKN